MARTLDARLAVLEARKAARLERDPVADWLASYRRGDDVDARNAAGGLAWCAMAAEHGRLADETLATFADDAGEYRPHGVT